MANYKQIKSNLTQLEAKILSTKEELSSAQQEMAHQLNAWHTGRVSSKDAIISAEMRVLSLSGKLPEMYSKLSATKAALDKAVDEFDHRD